MYRESNQQTVSTESLSEPQSVTVQIHELLHFDRDLKAGDHIATSV